ncbi:MAG: sterol carrier protein domain-containing protein, partial [Actinomycetota bacterium]
VDLVSYVKTWDRPLDEPLQWLLEEPRAMRGKLSDALMARPVDVGTALARRGYRGDGRLRIGVGDAVLPVNDGVYELRVEAGRAVCERTTGEPDVSGPVNVLGAVYFGGATWIELASAGMVREHRPGALVEADGVFASPVAPWAPYAF